MRSCVSKKMRRINRGRVPALPENSKAKNVVVTIEGECSSWEAGTLPTELHPQNKAILTPEITIVKGGVPV